MNKGISDKNINDLLYAKVLGIFIVSIVFISGLILYDLLIAALASILVFVVFSGFLIAQNYLVNIIGVEKKKAFMIVYIPCFVFLFIFLQLYIYPELIDLVFNSELIN